MFGKNPEATEEGTSENFSSEHIDQVLKALYEETEGSLMEKLAKDEDFSSIVFKPATGDKEVGMAGGS